MKYVFAILLVILAALVIAAPSSSSPTPAHRCHRVAGCHTPTPSPLPSPTFSPTPAPTPTVTPSQTPPPYGTIVWKAGDPVLGKWSNATSGQCGGPVVTGSSFYFDLKRTTNSCYRNQMLPLDQNGNLFYLTLHRVYTWTFTYIDGDPNGNPPGMGDDLGEAEAVLWQTHGTTEPHTPCSQLGWGNTPIGSPTGQPQQWLIDDCSGDLGHPFWTGKYTPQERIDFVIQENVSDGSDGFTTLYRNGQLVASHSGANFRPGTGNVFWNFGIYKWRWELSGFGGSLMTEVQDTINNMVLYEN